MTKNIMRASAIVSALALALSAAPAFANGGGEDINVSNYNAASIGNDVYVSASTGGNDANGSSASSAGNGGSVMHSEDWNAGGNGGNGGNGGDGGAIFTGDAYAGAGVENYVNSNDTVITVGCGCEDENDIDDVNVRNSNGAQVGNILYVKAKTGWNDANGGSASGAGSGGSVMHSDDHNQGGNGGNGGNAGSGGFIATGSAEAGALVLNYVNTNITRIRR